MTGTYSVHTMGQDKFAVVGRERIAVVDLNGGGPEKIKVYKIRGAVHGSTVHAQVWKGTLVYVYRQCKDSGLSRWVVGMWNPDDRSRSCSEIKSFKHKIDIFTVTEDGRFLFLDGDGLMGFHLDCSDEELFLSGSGEKKENSVPKHLEVLSNQSGEYAVAILYDGRDPRIKVWV